MSLVVRYVQTIIQIIRCADNIDLCQHCLHVDELVQLETSFLVLTVIQCFLYFRDHFIFTDSGCIQRYIHAYASLSYKGRQNWLELLTPPEYLEGLNFNKVCAWMLTI